MNEIDYCCIVIALAHAIKSKKTKKQNNYVKRLWMKNWHKRRDEFTHENLLNELKLSSPNDFRNFLRMDEETYKELLSLVGPRIQKQDTQMRDAISPSQRLSITLRFLATGSSFSDLKFTSAISERAIGRIIMETCMEINKELKSYIKIPSNEDEWKSVASDFNHRWNFPNCLGAIDGKHIAIKKPPNSGSFYYNYKKFFSIVLMAIANANYEFIMVDVGTKGRVSDGGVLHNTKFGKAFFEGNLNLPRPCKLPSTDKEMPFVFLADDAFQLTSNLMKPYSQPGLTEEQRIFNYRLSRARRIVENAFGILVSRFRVLQTAINLSPEKVQTVVLTCCYLHNFLRKKKTNEYISAGSVDCENLLNGSIIEGLWRNDCHSTTLQNTHCRNSTNTAKLVRDEFCNYFNNEGQVSWQKKFVNTKLNNP